MSDFKPTKIYYTPTAGEPEFTTAFGRMFKAGDAVTIEDENQFNKLKGNPQFTEDGKARKEPAQDPAAKALEKHIEKAAKEAEEAEAVADESNANKDAKQRALAQASSLQGAENARKAGQ